MKVLRVGDSLTVSHPKPMAVVRRIVVFSNPSVIRGQEDGNAIHLFAEAAGHGSYSVEFQAADGTFMGAAGEQFRVIEAFTKLARTKRQKRK